MWTTARERSSELIGTIHQSSSARQDSPKILKELSLTKITKKLKANSILLITTNTSFRRVMGRRMKRVIKSTMMKMENSQMLFKKKTFKIIMHNLISKGNSS